MAIRIPESKASIRQNQVEVFLPGEKKPYYIPKIQYLFAEQRLEMTGLANLVKPFIVDRKTDPNRQPSDVEADAMRAIEVLQREILETYIPGLYKKLTDDQVQALSAEWNQESGMSVGESSASAIS